ncbi:hypothetical protein FJ366_00160 [Candidatus Dependentiae bacterium]|nr:hypothetical protein [Candidatus Dependentiae bacterium]
MKKTHLYLLLFCTTTTLFGQPNATSSDSNTEKEAWYKFDSKRVLQTLIISALTVFGGCALKTMRNRCTARRIRKKVNQMNIPRILNYLKEKSKAYIKQSLHSEAEFRELGDTSDSSSCAGKYVIAQGSKALGLLGLDAATIDTLKQSRGVILLATFSRHPSHYASCSNDEIDVNSLSEILKMLCDNHIPHVTINLVEAAVLVGPGNCSGKAIIPQFSLVTMIVPGTSPAEKSLLQVTRSYSAKALEPEIDKIISYKVSRWILETTSHHESKTIDQTYNQTQCQHQRRKLISLLPFSDTTTINFT